jgi:hypothetical protein
LYEVEEQKITGHLSGFQTVSLSDFQNGGDSGVNVAAIAPDLSIKCDAASPCYPWRMAIVSTVFWIGETGSGPTNAHSAWDKKWVSSYGGIDDPVRRSGYRPAGFRPLENSFYVALPYCDIAAGRLKPEAAKVVPWFIERFRAPGFSVCKGHWLEIRHGDKICYAQWEDVGPFRTDSASYVFGDERPSPNVNHGAGIDVSPAVRDYLGLGSLDLVDWASWMGTVYRWDHGCLIKLGKSLIATTDRMVGKAAIPQCVQASLVRTTRHQFSSIKTAPSISVGARAPRKRYRGKIPASPKRDPRIDWPAGFGEFAITVSPPPVTAPAITTYLKTSGSPGTREAR